MNEKVLAQPVQDCIFALPKQKRSIRFEAGKSTGAVDNGDQPGGPGFGVKVLQIKH